MSQRRKNKPAAREGCYEIRFETSAVLAANPEPSDFVREISGAIKLSTCSGPGLDSWH